MYKNKLKLYNVYNKIYDNQIDKYLVLSKNNKNPTRKFYIFRIVQNSINNCLSLIENDEYIDSLCLLSSLF